VFLRLLVGTQGGQIRAPSFDVRVVRIDGMQRSEVVHCVGNIVLLVANVAMCSIESVVVPVYMPDRVDSGVLGRVCVSGRVSDAGGGGGSV
jgi:hypothetical protein